MILFLLAAAAQAAAQPGPMDTSAPVSSSQEAAGEMHRGPRPQLFVAPSGEPFHADPGAPYPVALWFAQANTGHDGKLTEAQFTADFVRFAETLDVNHDGVIDAGELQHYETAILPEVHVPDFAGRGGESGAGGGWAGHHRDGAAGAPGGDWANRPKGAGRFGLLPLPEPVAAMDVASDGRITRREVLDAAHARFAQLDTAHHGYLQLADLPQTWTQSHRHMGQHHDHGGGHWGGGHGDGGDRSGGMEGGAMGGDGGGGDQAQ